MFLIRQYLARKHYRKTRYVARRVTRCKCTRSSSRLSLKNESLFVSTSSSRSYWIVRLFPVR
jgi:hypothetical protein